MSVKAAATSRTRNRENGEEFVELAAFSALPLPAAQLAANAASPHSPTLPLRPWKRVSSSRGRESVPVTCCKPRRTTRRDTATTVWEGLEGPAGCFATSAASESTRAKFGDKACQQCVHVIIQGKKSSSDSVLSM